MEIFNYFKNYNSYIVGGAIRDYLLKKEIKDIDILIASTKSNFTRLIFLLSKKTNIFPLDEENGIYRINLTKNLTIDITNTDNIENDILKRDFTLNSLLIEIKKVKIKTKNNLFELSFNTTDIIDKLDAINDIKNKKIRKISDNCFKEDPVRLLRAFRFEATHNFKIEKNTFDLLSRSIKLVNKTSPERLREELNKIIETENSSEILKRMSKCGLIFEIIPELKLQTRCAEVYYGKGGVFKHTLNVLKRLDIFYQNPQKYLNISEKLKEKAVEEKKLIKLSALLHDIAKPHKAKIIEGRLRFFGHESYGGVLSEKILKNLRYSNNEIKYIKSIVSNHLRIGNIAHNNIISNRAILRIFYELKDYTLGLLILSWADHASYIGEKKLTKILKKTKEKPFEIKKKLPKEGEKKTLRFLQVVNMIARNYSKYIVSSDIKPIINGHTIMKTLFLNPSPKVGEIIRKLINLQLEGKIKTREQAISYIKSLKIT